MTKGCQSNVSNLMFFAHEKLMLNLMMDDLYKHSSIFDVLNSLRHLFEQRRRLFCVYGIGCFQVESP